MWRDPMSTQRWAALYVRICVGVITAAVIVFAIILGFIEIVHYGGSRSISRRTCEQCGHVRPSHREMRDEEWEAERKAREAKTECSETSGAQ